MMVDTLINKQIVLIQTDGFRKFGVLISFDTIYACLKFADGDLHYIPQRLILEILPDPRAKREDGN